MISIQISGKSVDKVLKIVNSPSKKVTLVELFGGCKKEEDVKEEVNSDIETEQAEIPQTRATLPGEAVGGKKKY